MQTVQNKSERRDNALLNLESLARLLRSFTADFYYLALKDAGYSVDERVSIIGAGFRIAQCKGWIQRSNVSVKSSRNSSNLHSVWISKVFGFYPDGTPIAKEDIEAEYAKWQKLGLIVPDDLARVFMLQNALVKTANAAQIPFAEETYPLPYRSPAFKPRPPHTLEKILRPL